MLLSIQPLHYRQVFCLDTKDACKHVELLELTVFDLIARSIVDTIIMIIPHDVTLEVHRSSGLIDALYIPAGRLSIKDTFDFGIMIECHDTTLIMTANSGDCIDLCLEHMLAGLLVCGRYYYPFYLFQCSKLDGGTGILCIWQRLVLI